MESYKAGKEHQCACCGKWFLISYRTHKYWKYKKRIRNTRYYYCSEICWMQEQNKGKIALPAGREQTHLN